MSSTLTLRPMCAPQREDSPLDSPRGLQQARLGAGVVDARKGQVHAQAPEPALAPSEGQPAAVQAHGSGESSPRSSCELSLTSDSFRMYHFKVDACPLFALDPDHGQADCPYAHSGERARRRDPRLFPYTCAPCPEFRKGACRRGDACNLAHGVFESWLHPTKYRTLLCHDAAACTRPICFFAHSAAELRVASPPPQVPGSTAAAATTRPVAESSQASSTITSSSGSALGAPHHHHHHDGDGGSRGQGQRHSKSATALHRVNTGHGTRHVDGRPSASSGPIFPSASAHPFADGGVKPWSPYKPSPSSPRGLLHCAPASQGGSPPPASRRAAPYGTGVPGGGYASAAAFRPGAAWPPAPPPEAMQRRHLAQQQQQIHAAQLSVMAQHAANVQTQQRLWQQQRQLLEQQQQQQQHHQQQQRQQHHQQHHQQQQRQQHRQQQLLFLEAQQPVAPHSSGSGIPHAAASYGLSASPALPPSGATPRLVWHEDWTTLGDAAAPPAASEDLLLGLGLPGFPAADSYGAGMPLAGAAAAAAPSTGALALDEFMLLEQQLRAAALLLAEAAPAQKRPPATTGLFQTQQQHQLQVPSEDFGSFWPPPPSASGRFLG